MIYKNINKKLCFKKIMQFVICNLKSNLKTLPLQFIYPIILYINILRYSYQKMNSLRNILYFML